RRAKRDTHECGCLVEHYSAMEYRTCLFAAPPTCQNIAVCGRSRTPESASRQVLVALEPGVEGARHDVGRMNDVAGHQRISRCERGLERGTAQHLVRSNIRERVLELVLSSDGASGERLPARRVGRVLDLPVLQVDGGAHGNLLTTSSWA